MRKNLLCGDHAIRTGWPDFPGNIQELSGHKLVLCASGCPCMNREVGPDDPKWSHAAEFFCEICCHVGRKIPDISTHNTVFPQKACLVTHTNPKLSCIILLLQIKLNLFSHLTLDKIEKQGRWLLLYLFSVHSVLSWNLLSKEKTFPYYRAATHCPSTKILKYNVGQTNWVQDGT